MKFALDVLKVSHSYGQRTALHEVCLSVDEGEIFALLGPNGSGKTTLFRLISTLATIQRGDIVVMGCSVRNETTYARSQLGVVFQSPSLDPKLTVEENIRCQAALYGLSGQSLTERMQEVVEQLGIADRLRARTDELSGGLKRRVELAKGILHKPRFLLMDEPSTGLDPASRLDLWHALRELQRTASVTILLTTHLLEEADKADRIAIMHQGQIVAVGKPSDLRNELGEQILSVQTSAGEQVLQWLSERSLKADQVEQQIRVVGSHTAEIVAPLTAEFGERIQSLTLGRPSLEDVFIAKTGHRYWTAELKSPSKKKPARKR